MSTDPITIRPVSGIPGIRPGDDLATVIGDRLADQGLRDGDIVMVSSKVVSKAEGRLRPAATREEALAEETVRVVAVRGGTQIVQTRHGFVMAAAGIDASNVEADSIALLPIDPDGSARRLRAGLSKRFGDIRLGVVVTDTFGRPWRMGQTDLAIGAAGVMVMDLHTGRVDSYGNELAVTAPALADELAAAADLAKPKLGSIPVAVIEGLPHLVTDDDGPGVAVLVRPSTEDMFRLGTREATERAALLPRTVPTSPDATTVETSPTTVDPIDAAMVRRTVTSVVAAVTAELSGGLRSETATVGFELNVIEDDRIRKPLLDLLGLPATAPLLLTVWIRRDGVEWSMAEPAMPADPSTFGDPTAAALAMAAGAAADRALLALSANGVTAVRPAGGVDIGALTEFSHSAGHAPGDLCLTGYALLVGRS